MKRQFRPKRDKFVAFYVTEDEKNLIIDAAIQADLNLSDYCRKTLIAKSYNKQPGEQEDVRENT